jgi:hypothetical protein
MLALVTGTGDGDGLGRLDAFLDEIDHAAWFAACGEPLTLEERAEAETYVAALGQPGLSIEGVARWRDAALVTQRADWSQEWWQAETAAEAALRLDAVRRFGETALLTALTRVMDRAQALHGAAALAAQRQAVADPAVTRVAAGAAAQACHQAALARLSGAGPDHLFAVKYRLFAAGRWPLGVVGGRCFVL